MWVGRDTTPERTTVLREGEGVGLTEGVIRVGEVADDEGSTRVEGRLRLWLESFRLNSGFSGWGQTSQIESRNGKRTSPAPTSGRTVDPKIKTRTGDHTTDSRQTGFLISGKPERNRRKGGHQVRNKRGRPDDLFEGRGQSNNRLVSAGCKTLKLLIRRVQEGQLLVYGSPRETS